ncbi:hypothetical protein EDB85DRAFT_1988286 [Lactarius pseudohatsudake]|nr:hypothetical protein EDB85DRAFT_1988286 [Lactarius pseudohatsudake]
MALLFSFLGAYMMKLMGGTRTTAFIARLPRTSKHPRCHITPDHQPSPLPIAGSRQPRHSAPRPRSPGKDIRANGNCTSPLGPAFDSLWSRDT